MVLLHGLQLLTICDEDDDTLFFFNYRSDRMREIAAVFGLPEKPMEVKVPKNLVRMSPPSLQRKY